MPTSFETIDAFDFATGAYEFTLDELQKVTIENSQDKSDITGKNSRKLGNVKRNKAVTISGTHGLVSHGLLEAQTGGTFENKEVEIMWTDYLTVSENAATTSYKAIGTTGAEIIELYTKDSNGIASKNSLEQSDTAASGKFAYDPGTKKLTFSGINDGTEIVVFYKRKVSTNTLDNTDDTFSRKLSMYINYLAEDKCANVYRVQIFIPKADFDGNFSLEVGSDQTTHEFSAESLAGTCGIGNKLWSYTIFGVDQADA